MVLPNLQGEIFLRSSCGAFWCLSASSQDLERGCDQQKTGQAGANFRAGSMLKHGCSPLMSEAGRSLAFQNMHPSSKVYALATGAFCPHRLDTKVHKVDL